VALVDFAINLAILFGLMVWYGFWPTWHIALLPAFVVLAMLASLGPAFLITALNVKYRDLRYIIPYHSVHRPVRALHLAGRFFERDRARTLAVLVQPQPMVGVIDGFRWCVLGGESRLYAPGFLLSLGLVALFLWRHRLFPAYRTQLCRSDLTWPRMSLSAPRGSARNKKYVIGHAAERERLVTLRDTLARGASNFWRKTAGMARGRAFVAGDSVEEFWALKDVSFEVKRGEVQGVIGRNGAGKSTLLKILSRITEPSEGQVTIDGRVASLLEVGTGFHPELTGRENIYLNGAILGMGRGEIRRKFDEIVAFAEVEKFLDTPVKRYSSGMYVRLAFAVAAHLEPDILVVDEVLAVGDVEFQKKCLGKMDEVSRREGRTVLFVSHNMVAVRSLCQRALMISNGILVVDGSVTTVVTRYLELTQGSALNAYWTEKTTAPGTSNLRVKRVRVSADGPEHAVLTMQTPLHVKTDHRLLNTGMGSHLTYHLVNGNETIVLTSWGPTELAPGSYRATCKIPGDLLNSGTYSESSDCRER
jgi:lipopolysaccharide transport system ATP-binding protein